MYLFGQFSRNGYIVYNETSKTIGVLESESTPDLARMESLYLRYKLMGDRFNLNRDNFVVMYFDSETFSTKNVLVIGVDDKILTPIDNGRCYGVFMDGAFCCSEYINNLVIDYICIAPQVESITGLGFGNVPSKSDIMYIPKSIQSIGLGAIHQKNLSKLVIEGSNTTVDIEDLLRLNQKLRTIEVTKSVYERYHCTKYKDILVWK